MSAQRHVLWMRGRLNQHLAVSWFVQLFIGSIFLLLSDPSVVLGENAPGPVDTQPLIRVELASLPAEIADGAANGRALVDYYRQSNAGLVHRFEHVRQIHDSGKPFRGVTLVAGAAGVGKTFLKKQVMGQREFPPQLLHGCDLSELYKAWLKDGKTIQKPDLAAGNVVFNSLPGRRSPTSNLLYEHLDKQEASFFIVDSLDEIHPDDYVAVLEQIERFAFDSDRRFVHLIVLGRGLAFRDYWQLKAGHYPSSAMNLFMLEAPSLSTTGDLMVSSWNYHAFKHKLSWADRPMDFADFQNWANQGYARSGKYRDVITHPTDAVRQDVLTTLEGLARQHRFIPSVLNNLAGNSIVREIVDERVRQGLPPGDVQAIKDAYFAKWLERDTKSDDRPSISKPAHLSAYMRALESLAVKTLQDGVDSRGFFTLEDDDMIEIEYQGELLYLPAYRVLNRSGLKYLDPRTPGSRRYRFEPVWFHRLLVDRYNERLEGTNRVKLRMAAQGNLELDGHPGTLESIEGHLQRTLEQRLSNHVRVDIHVDAQSPLPAQLLEIVRVCHRLKVQDIHIHTETWDAPHTHPLLSRGTSSP